MAPAERELEALEDRVTRRMADSVESLGEIIKEYATKYQQLAEKLKHLESGGKVKITGSNVVRTKIVPSHKKTSTVTESVPSTN